ncbi:hypothetical protein BDW22DRAFT_1349827 [Trametopsis cervina]|nr:hypothetical protein BDW22DRAFT_1349827 [Trametopsis cervina]
MSTRVQKGNTVFRPITKARARLGSEARQTSLTPDARSSVDPTMSPASTSMPPPALPYRPSAQVFSPQDHFSNDAPGSTDASPLPFNVPREPLLHAASSIAVPSRNTVRSPAIQSFTSTSRVSTPVPPRIQSGTSRQGAISTATPIGTPSRYPTSIFTPARAIPNVGSGRTGETQPAVHPSAPAPIAPALAAHSAISDAQIDPALLEAVVTALQHVNDAEQQHPSALSRPGIHGEASESTAQSIPAMRSHSTPNELTGEEAGTSEAGQGSVRPRRASRRSSRQDEDQGEEVPGDEDHPSSDLRKRRKRLSTSSTTPRKRRSRAPSVPPYDPGADPGEELDPTAVTMAELCDDTGRGRVSTKAMQIMTSHAAWRTSNREKRARMRSIMEAKKYGRNAEDEENVQSQQNNSAEPTADVEESSNQPIAGPSASRPQSVEAEAADEGDKGDDYDYTQAMSTSRYNVQVRIGPNGETIIDEASLLVDRQEEDDTANYTHVEESDTSKFVNSMSYSKKLRGSRWSAEETELFFDALSQFGENYELISYVLPGRDRKACKNKFKAEDKRNPNRITYCLNHRRPYDLQTLARMTGKDFSGPTPEIRAPPPLRLPHVSEAQAEDDSEESVKLRKHSATPGLGAEEILEDPEEVIEPGS